MLKAYMWLLSSRARNINSAWSIFVLTLAVLVAVPLAVLTMIISGILPSTNTYASELTIGNSFVFPPQIPSLQDCYYHDRIYAISL